MVEVVSCLELDGRDVYNDIRWGVYVVIEAPGEYQRECFAQYGLKTDSSGRYAVQYKPFHLIGLELGVSVANIMCRGEPTGQTKTWKADVVATAKRDLKAGEKLDGEGGFMVYGKLFPAQRSLEIEGLPIGLAHGLVLKQDVKKDHCLSWQDVEFSEDHQAVAVRRRMEDLYRQESGLGKQPSTSTFDFRLERVHAITYAMLPLIEERRQLHPHDKVPSQRLGLKRVEALATQFIDRSMERDAPSQANLGEEEVLSDSCGGPMFAQEQ
ncbi:hypothetical protein LTR05_001616 [Lithohypha guttulata]|uniref:SAF domain-containing protein n=1 Tax=Lithohypha guttulata TaxID=1690604 RepID=A0AAN7T6V4_9EURO|nr:hypothetical protein LTR05_001616 [Lithohypha guttulata]